MLCAVVAGALAQVVTAEVKISGIGIEAQGTVAASLRDAAAAQNMAAFATAEKIYFPVMILVYSPLVLLFGTKGLYLTNRIIRVLTAALVVRCVRARRPDADGGASSRASSTSARSRCSMVPRDRA